MIDQDDADFALFILPGSGVLGIIGLIVWACIQYSACQNESDCAKRSCDDGLHPVLTAHECLCVKEAKP